MSDTIFALATAPGRGAVAIVRLSGPRAGALLTGLAGSPTHPRVATLRKLRDDAGATIDRALVLWFPGPDSFTGEDGAEFHLHGGAAVVDGLTRALMAGGARLAEPGEFTRRAFENGKLDLAQAESIADLVDSETTSQARQALDQLEGGLSRRYLAWREALIASLSLLEAAIDFPEDDAEARIARAITPSLQGIRDELAAALADSLRGERIRDGYRIALIGAPNAGKSSIINRLSGRDSAIVSSAPGTTRDVIEVPLVIGGYKVIVGDAAGLRESEDEVEAEGARRARQAGTEAALRLWVVDGSASNGAWEAGFDLVCPGDFCLINKVDLPEGSDSVHARAEAGRRGVTVIEVSATVGDTAGLVAGLREHVTQHLGGADFPAATRVRHRELLSQSLAHLDRALNRLGEADFAAEDLRLACRAVERVTGAIGVEDILDRVFSTFCIGK